MVGNFPPCKMNYMKILETKLDKFNGKITSKIRTLHIFKIISETVTTSSFPQVKWYNFPILDSTRSFLGIRNNITFRSEGDFGKLVNDFGTSQGTGSCLYTSLLCVWRWRSKNKRLKRRLFHLQDSVLTKKISIFLLNFSSTSNSRIKQ